jgi:DNA-binding transcriptional ArsR family regulator
MLCHHWRRSSAGRVTVAFSADEREPRPTTADDLHAALACPTRQSVLLALSGLRRDARSLAALLEIRPNLLSHHTRTLVDLGLADLEPEGKRHFWRLRAAVVIKRVGEGLAVTLTASDGGRVTQEVPWGSPLMRLLAPGLRAAGISVPGRHEPRRPAGSARGTPDHARTPPHRPSARG